MRALTNRDFLDLWERGSALHPLDRALLVLATADLGEPYEALADWPLGRRNAALIRLRREWFGSALTGWISCPRCSGRLEFSFDTGILLDQPDEAASELSVDGRSFRALTTRDLASVAADSDESAAAHRLLRQCCSEKSEFTDEELELIGERLAEHDPLAETLLDFSCAPCGHRWAESLDIAAWLWAEIEARSRRLLRDVHALAAAYGWTEPEILALSEPRRALYLEMVQA